MISKIAKKVEDQNIREVLEFCESNLGDSSDYDQEQVMRVLIKFDSDEMRKILQILVEFEFAKPNQYFEVLGKEISWFDLCVQKRCIIGSKILVRRGHKLKVDRKIPEEIIKGGDIILVGKFINKLYEYRYKVPESPVFTKKFSNISSNKEKSKMKSLWADHFSTPFLEYDNNIISSIAIVKRSRKKNKYCVLFAKGKYVSGYAAKQLYELFPLNKKILENGINYKGNYYLFLKDMFSSSQNLESGIFEPKGKNEESLKIEYSCNDKKNYKEQINRKEINIEEWTNEKEGEKLDQNHLLLIHKISKIIFILVVRKSFNYQQLKAKIITIMKFLSSSGF